MEKTSHLNLRTTNSSTPIHGTMTGRSFGQLTTQMRSRRTKHPDGYALQVHLSIKNTIKITSMTQKSIPSAKLCIMFFWKSTVGRSLTRVPRIIAKYYVPDSILKDTLIRLREIGYDYNEGIAYWVGNLDKETATITRAIFADDYLGFHNWTYHARVSLSTTFKIEEEIHSKNEILFAQIHTHPREAFHSFVDNTYPISHRIGFVSIVIPNFARNVTSLSECAIFEYLGKARWDELSIKKITDKFIVGEKAEFQT